MHSCGSTTNAIGGSVPGTAFTSLEMIRKLVSFDTTSRLSNLALIDFVRDYLDGYGVASDLIYDADNRKANLYATLGPLDRPGVMLSGHTDVVPVDGQPWDSDPFRIVERDGRLYGRGSSDMKSFLAVALALVPEFLGRNLTTPVHLALSYDEEVGCIGVRGLIAALAERPVRPRLCIIGEPTMMQPVIAHKGKKSVRCHVHGLESHSALAHLGVNAVEAAAEVVAHLKKLARDKRDRGPFDHAFSPPYTTIHTGTINGGTALNIVPRECRFDFEFRFLPEDDPDALLDEVRRHADTLLPEMHAVSPATGIVFEVTNEAPGLRADPDDEVVHLAQSLSGANSVGKVSYATEGGLFEVAGIPTVICGPGSIEQAHKPNEFIAVEQVQQCEAFMRRLMDRVAS
jgi:acetylornithine deacetylase